MNKEELIAIRPFVESDRPFVMATIMRGLYCGGSWFSDIPRHIFFDKYRKTIEYILNKPDVEVRLACLREDPEIILGYAIVEPKNSVVHWVFVKQAWRKIGIARSLIPSDVKWASHVNKVGLSIIKNKGLHFNPFVI
jgi:GNAT superfamily N-acetyltransferase